MSADLETTIELASKLTLRERLQLIEKIVLSLEKHLLTLDPQEASEFRHSVNTILDALEEIGRTSPHLVDTVAWVTTCRPLWQ